MTANADELDSPDRTLSLDVVWPMGRDLMLMSDGEERHLIGSFEDFELVLFSPGTDNLTLWYFAEAWDTMKITTKLLSPGLSAVFGLYADRDHSFYISDEALPTLLVIDSDYSEELRRSFATRIGRAHVHIGNRIYESHLKHGPATTVREVIAPPRHIFSAELDLYTIWAELISDTEDDAYRLHSFPEALCYWAEALNRYDPTLFETFDRDVQILIKYVGDADEVEEPWIYEGDGVENKDIVFILHTPQLPPSDAPANFLDRELLATLARVLLSSRLPVEELNDETEKIVAALAPPGERRMVHIVQSDVDLIAWPGQLPSARRVQPSVIALLLDQLGNELRTNRGRSTGQIADSDRLVVLNKEVVPFFGDFLQDQLISMKAIDLLKSLILQNEALLHEEYTERSRYASRLACFGHGPDEADRLAKHLAATNTASISSRFLIEYTAALQPQGDRIVTDEAYDKILALSSEVVNKGFISDALHAGISQAELSILPSGRLGISRDTDRYTRALQDLMSATANATIDEALLDATEREKDGDGETGSFAEAEKLASREFGFSFTELSLFTSELLNLSHEAGQEDVGILTVADVRERVIQKFEWDPALVDSILGQLRLGQVADFWRLGASVLPWRFNRSRSYLRKPLIIWNVNDVEHVIFGHRNTIRTAFELYGQYLSGRLQARSAEMREALSAARERKGDNFEKRVESEVAKICSPVLRRVDRFGDLDLHDVGGLDLGDVDIAAFDPSSRSLYIIEAKSLIVARTPRELQNEISNIHDGEHSAAARLAKRIEAVVENRGTVLDHLGLSDPGIAVVGLIVIDADLVSARFDSPFDIVTLEQLLTHLREVARTS